MIGLSPSEGRCYVVVVLLVIEVVTCNFVIGLVTAHVLLDYLVEFSGYLAEYFFCPVVVTCHADDGDEDDEGYKGM